MKVTIPNEIALPGDNHLKYMGTFCVSCMHSRYQEQYNERIHADSFQ